MLAVLGSSRYVWEQRLSTGYVVLGKSSFPSGSATAYLHYSSLKDSRNSLRKGGKLSQEGCWLESTWSRPMAVHHGFPPTPAKLTPRTLDRLQSIMNGRRNAASTQWVGAKVAVKPTA